jgi:adenine phosphoribosyltransferase
LKDLKKCIRDIPDFPAPGILFRDITPLLADKQAVKQSVNQLAEPFKNQKIDTIAAIEARGFIFGCALACKLNAGFVPIRKKGKLPWKTKSYTYKLEYGQDTIEVHQDAVKPKQKVIIVDDLLATGGTMEAACQLIQQLKAEIHAVAFLVELSALNGRQRLQNQNIFSLLKY